MKDGGYLTSNPTGNFADATLQAVIDFQDAHGLLADGIVGDKTKNALWNAYAVKMQEEGVKELP